LISGRIENLIQLIVEKGHDAVIIEKEPSDILRPVSVPRIVSRLLTAFTLNELLLKKVECGRNMMAIKQMIKMSAVVLNGWAIVNYRKTN